MTELDYKLEEALLLDYPDPLLTRHLIELMIFNDFQDAFRSRKRGDSPEFYKLGGKMQYPKDSVFEFLKAKRRLMS